MEFHFIGLVKFVQNVKEMPHSVKMVYVVRYLLLLLLLLLLLSLLLVVVVIVVVVHVLLHIHVL